MDALGLWPKCDKADSPCTPRANCNFLGETAVERRGIREAAAFRDK